MASNNYNTSLVLLPMLTFFATLTGIFMLLTLVTLFSGVICMTLGQEFNQKYSNKLMSARIYCQAIAVGCLLVTVFLTT